MIMNFSKKIISLVLTVIVVFSSFSTVLAWDPSDPVTKVVTGAVFDDYNVKLYYYELMSDGTLYVKFYQGEIKLADLGNKYLEKIKSIVVDSTEISDVGHTEEGKDYYNLYIDGTLDYDIKTLSFVSSSNKPFYAVGISSFKHLENISIQQDMDIRFLKFWDVGLENLDFLNDATIHSVHLFTTYYEDSAVSTLNEVVVPSGIEYFHITDKNVKKVKITSSETGFGFTGCTSLKEIIIPNGQTDIYPHTFEDCLSLKTVDLPDTLIFLSQSAFKNSGIVSIEIPSGVKQIDDDTFDGCLNLESITIPKSVTRIDESAFLYLSSCEPSPLKNVYYEGSKADWDKIEVEKTLSTESTVEIVSSDLTLEQLFVTAKINFNSTGPTPTPTSTPTSKPTKKPTATPTAKPTKKPTATPTPTKSPVPTNGPKLKWVQEDGKWYFFDNNGSKIIDWGKINGVWYFFDKQGVMQTGWVEVGGKWYYFNKSGAMVTGWIQVGKNWYYLGSSGAMVTGWFENNGKWYYMSSSGAMVTGWVLTGGKWYYMGPSGAMVTSWAKISGKWYYMSKSGAMVTGWNSIGANLYYFDTNGAMVTGKQTIGGKTYNFDENGALDVSVH